MRRRILLLLLAVGFALEASADASALDLTLGQQNALMLLVMALIAKYYFTRVLVILERVPDEPWFAAVDASMKAIIQIEERSMQHEREIAETKERMKGYSERIRLVEIAQAGSEMDHGQTRR